MKKYFISIGTGLLLVIVLLFACNDERHTSSVDVQKTEIDELFASEEYQNYEKALKNYSDELMSRMNSLSKEDRQQLTNIAEQVIGCPEADKVVLYKQMRELLGGDLEKYSEQMDVAAKKAFPADRKFTADELYKAMMKQMYNNRPQVKSMSATTPLEACLGACRVSFEAAEKVCQGSHFHATVIAEVQCKGEREGIFVMCQNRCQKEYGESASDTTAITIPSVNTTSTTPTVKTTGTDGNN